MKWLRIIHLIHGILFSVMLLTGLCLFFSGTRTWFNQIGFPLVQFHLVIACGYFLLTFVSLARVGRYLLKKPRIKKFNFYFNTIFFFTWSISGILMYFQASIPAEMRNSAVVVHDWATFLFLPWVGVHIVGHLFKVHLPWPSWWKKQVPLPPSIQENQFERRDFLKLFGFTFVFLLIGGGVKWFTPILSIANSETKRRGYFRIYNVTNEIPSYPNNDWALKIDGLTNKEVEVGYYDLLRLPSTTIVDDFHCVTGWSVTNVEMKGVLLKDLLKAYEIEVNGEFVTAYSGDETYFDSFVTKQLIDEESYLVYEMDGEPLKSVQGYPCRLYQPNMYGYKSVKWLERLYFSDSREIGYWQQSGGYDLDGYL